MTNYVNQDEIEDLHRRIAFAEACSEPLNFDQNAQSDLRFT